MGVRGKEADIMYCDKCGAQIAEDSRFCKSCGVPVAQQKSPPVRKDKDSQPKPLFTAKPWLSVILAISKIVLIGGILAAVVVGVAGELGWGVPTAIGLLSVIFFILVESEVELVHRIGHIDENTRVSERNVRTIARILSSKEVGASDVQIETVEVESPEVQVEPSLDKGGISC